MSGRIRSRALATLLLLALAASPASAAPGWEDLGRAAWQILAGVLFGDGGLKTRCTIDPNGVAYCVPDDAAPKPRGQGRQGNGMKGGCGIDPNGKQVCW